MCMGLSFFCPLTHHLFILALVWVIMTGWFPATQRWGGNMKGLGPGSCGGDGGGVGGLSQKETHAWSGKSFLRALELGWQPSCGYQGQWAEGALCGSGCVCVGCATILQSLRASAGVTVWEISTDVRPGSQLSSWSSRDGFGGVKWECRVSDLARSFRFCGEQQEHFFAFFILYFSASVSLLLVIVWIKISVMWAAEDMTQNVCLRFQRCDKLSFWWHIHESTSKHTNKKIFFFFSLVKADVLAVL